jgi:hypothetical protein
MWPLLSWTQYNYGPLLSWTRYNYVTLVIIDTVQLWTLVMVHTVKVILPLLSLVQHNCKALLTCWCRRTPLLYQRGQPQPHLGYGWCVLQPENTAHKIKHLFHGESTVTIQEWQQLVSITGHHMKWYKLNWHLTKRITSHSALCISAQSTCLSRSLTTATMLRTKWLCYWRGL